MAFMKLENNQFKTVNIPFQKILLLEAYLKKNPVTLYLILFVFGLITAFVFIRPQIFIDNTYDHTHMSIRIFSLEEAIKAFNNEGFYYFKDHLISFYYYLALLGKLFRINDPIKLFTYAQMAAAFFLLSAYPAIMYRLSKSLVVSFLTPVLASIYLGTFLFRSRMDSQWAMAWVIIFAVPLLSILFSEKWTKQSWGFYGAVCVIISISNTIRIQSAFPIVIITLVLVISKLFVITKAKDSEKKTCLFVRIVYFAKCNIPLFIAIVLLFVSQTFFVMTLPKILFPSLINSDLMNGYNHDKFDFKVMGPWHTIYIGIGWESNPFGIDEFNDNYGFLKSDEINTGRFRYMSDEYIDTLKTEYFRLLRENPSFFIGSYSRKLFNSIDITYNYLRSAGTIFFSNLLAFGFLLVICLKNTQKKIWSVCLPMMLCSLFCIFAGMLPAMLAIPAPLYLIGSLGACDMLIFTTVIFFILNIQNFLETKQGHKIAPDHDVPTC